MNVNTGENSLKDEVEEYEKERKKAYEEEVNDWIHKTIDGMNLYLDIRDLFVTIFDDKMNIYAVYSTNKAYVVDTHYENFYSLSRKDRMLLLQAVTMLSGRVEGGALN